MIWLVQYVRVGLSLVVQISNRVPEYRVGVVHACVLLAGFHFVPISVDYPVDFAIQSLVLNQFLWVAELEFVNRLPILERGF